mgnify:CR=1 FL=1
MCALCNESGVEFDDVKMKYKAVGEPTEAALQILVEKIGLPASSDVVGIEERIHYRTHATNYWKSKYEVKATLEFSRTRKSMSVICAPKVGERTCLHRREWSAATSCS